MKAWLARAWNGWLGWVVVILGCLLYARLKLAEQEDDRQAREDRRLRQEVSEKVGADLRASSDARQAKLKADIQALTRRPPSPSAPAP